MKIEITKKLFYKKWLYKIEVHQLGVCYIKRLSLEDINDLDTTSKRSAVSTLYMKAASNKKNLIATALFLEQLKTSHEFFTRVEGDYLGIYTNDIDILEKVRNEFKNNVFRLWQPKTVKEQDFLTKNSNVVICKKLPNHDFRFKSYIGSLEKVSRNITDQFLSWAKNYQDSIIIPNATRELFEASYRGYSFNNYLYIRDAKTLMMVNMYLGGLISRTEQYILDEEIV